MIKRSDFRRIRKQGGYAGIAMLAAAIMMTQPALTCYAAGKAEKTEKAETVFVIANAAGDRQEVLVSDWLKNAAGEEILTDETILKEIENLKGDETWTASDGDQIVWNAGGNDIFYRGTTEQDLPVNVTVTYTLDGEEMTPEQMAGKSGEVTIRYDYQNTAVQEVEIKGKTYEFHVPFAAVTALLLNEKVLSDIEITNGRLISDGDHLAALGIALPGIAQDMETEAYASLNGLMKYDIPDYVEIKAHAENFTLGTTYTVVTNELFSGEEIDLTSVIKDISTKLGMLKTGVGQIVDGISSLKDGAGTLKDGTAKVAQGLSDLTAQNETLIAGSRQIFEGILAQVQEQLVNAGIPEIELTAENYGEVLDTIIENLGKTEDPAAAGQAALVTEAKERLDGCRDFCDGLKAYTDGASSINEGASEIKAGASQLESGASKLALETSVIKALLPDTTGISDALKATAELAQNYRSFTGLADGMDGKVRFIWKIEGIE